MFNQSLGVPRELKHRKLNGSVRGDSNKHTHDKVQEIVVMSMLNRTQTISHSCAYNFNSRRLCVGRIKLMLNQIILVVGIKQHNKPDIALFLFDEASKNNHSLKDSFKVINDGGKWSYSGSTAIALFYDNVCLIFHVVFDKSDMADYFAFDKVIIKWSDVC